MKKNVRRVGVILGLLFLVLLGSGAITVYVLHRGLKQVPRYYEQALRVEPEAQKEAGAELQKRVVQLHNEVISEGRWEALFSAQVINGWLAADLPEKFPDALPKEISAPRVAIKGNKLLIACRHTSERLDAVVNLDLEVHLTDEPNVIAIRVCQARAGVVPLPLKQYLELVTKSARKGGISLRWEQIEEDPVALITIPRNRHDFVHREILVETIALRDGELYLSGTTELNAQRAETAVRVEADAKPGSSL